MDKLDKEWNRMFRNEKYNFCYKYLDSIYLGRLVDSKINLKKFFKILFKEKKKYKDEREI